MLLVGAGPLTLFTIGIRFLPGGVLPWLWYIMTLILAVLAALIFSGRATLPLKQAISAFRGLINPDRGEMMRRWVPEEFWAVRDDLKKMLKDVETRNAQLEALSTRQDRSTKAAERAAVRSLEVLRGLTDTLKEAVVFIHGEGHIALMNGAAELMFRSDEHEITPGMDGAGWLRHVAGQFEGGAALATEWEAWNSGPPGLMQGEWTTKGESPRVIAVKTFGVRADEGEDLGRVWVFSDITSDRQVAQRLQDSQKLESIGQLAGGIAHDFNNLLTAIRGSLALAQLDGVDIKQQREHLENATKAAAHATELVGQILGYSRSKTKAAYVDVKQLVTETQNLLRASLDPRIQLQCRVENETWLAAIPHVELEQVLINLCFNARDALGDSGGFVQIFTSHFVKSPGSAQEHAAEALPGEYVVVHVKDCGSGIPPEVQQKLFEPFFTTKEPGKGTGLGLATSFRIIQDAGGWLEFDTTVGKGTEFRVYVPRATKLDASLVKDEAPAAPREALMPTPARGSQEGLIMVVDDEASVRSIAVNMLKYLGYKVIEASSGEQALEHMKVLHPHVDAIMLDVHMPRKSGRETFTDIRKAGYEAPVIVCSGFTIEAEEFKASTGERGGSVSVIQKPYTLEKLAKVVGNAVDLSHSALPA